MFPFNLPSRNLDQIIVLPNAVNWDALVYLLSHNLKQKPHVSDGSIRNQSFAMENRIFFYICSFKSWMVPKDSNLFLSRLFFK